MTCDVCRYSVVYARGQLECRRNPPVVNPNFVAIGAFPLVKVDMWCGEFEPKQIVEMI